MMLLDTKPGSLIDLMSLPDFVAQGKFEQVWPTPAPQPSYRRNRVLAVSGGFVGMEDEASSGASGCC